MNIAKHNTEMAREVKIFLIGMMGSGKTYWAQILKKALKISAYDLDNLIEMMEEQSVAEMFEKHGEDYFRKEEAKMLRLFKEKKKCIISCGGGTPCYHNNMDWMNSQGITLWIDEPVEVLVKRLQPEKDHRPLIKSLSNDQLHSFLEGKLFDRLEYYNKAAYRLEGEQLNTKYIVQLIKKHA